jgi:hypothetical protein
MASRVSIADPTRVLAAAALLGALGAGGCGITAGRTCDEFPASAGFQPLERDFTDVAFPPAPGGVYPQAMNVVSGPSIAHSWAHGRGYVRCAPAKVYQALHDPAASRIRPPGDHWSPSPGIEAGYDISYEIEYVVYKTITIRWTVRTRGGLLAGTDPAQPGAVIGMRYQRTCGDEHISLESGSLQAQAAPGDPNVTQLELVGWLNATTQGPSDVEGTLRDWFANLTGVLSGMSCP